jgi:hypothetical protein
MSPSEQTAIDQALSYCQLIRIETSTRGIRWVLGTGYVDIWELIHGAEEALLLVKPVEDVVRMAIYDALRLQDSQITNNTDLLAKLRLAVSQLDPGSAPYLATGPSAPKPAEAGATEPAPSRPGGARAVLAQVHQSIDAFRDQSWDALARTRNQVLGTIAVTGIVTLLLLGLALALSTSANIDPFSDSIVAGSAFFLIGAMVGLFNRMYQESSSDKSVEDYGLSTAHLILTPILSGLAALGGVLVVAMLPSVMSSGIFTVGPATAATPATIPALADIYTLQGNHFGIIFAGIFGLTPGLLLASLQNAADQYRANIKSTAPAASS